jgi:phosphinothricin acetyltransferase
MIRLAEIKDAEQILGIYAPYVENTIISFEEAAPTKEEMEKRISHVMENHVWIVLEEDNKILGYAYSSDYNERTAYRWSADVSIYVDGSSHRRGIGKALYTSLFEILRYQGYCNAYAGICLPNEKSVGIHEYFGFRKIAQYNKVGYKHGDWHDVGWWELSLKKHDNEPGEPLPIRRIEPPKLYNAFTHGMQIISK